MLAAATLGSSFIFLLVLVTPSSARALDCRKLEAEFLHEIVGIRDLLAKGENSLAQHTLTQIEAPFRHCPQEALPNQRRRSLATLRAITEIGLKNWSQVTAALDSLIELEVQEAERQEMLSLRSLATRLSGHSSMERSTLKRDACIEEIMAALRPAVVRIVCRELPPLRRSFWSVVASLLSDGRAEHKELNYLLEASSLSPLHREFLRALLNTQVRQLPVLPDSRWELDASCSCDAEGKMKVVRD